MNHPPAESTHGLGRWRGSPLTAAAWSELVFWSVVAAGLFFLFHLHGCSQEMAVTRGSLFRWLRSRWTGDFAYGMFLPLGSVAALWLRRRELAAAPRQPDWRGAPLVVLALGLHWLGVLAQQPRISAAGLIGLLWSFPFLLYGWALARWLLFPVGYLFLAIPLNFIDSMTAPLRLFATAVSAALLNGFGLEVQRVGAGLFSGPGASFAFNVAPECSGLRSLLAMTALMGFYGWWSQPTLLKKWLLFLFSVPVAIIANIFRILLVVVVAALFGQKLAMDLWHDYSGYPIFLIGIALMLALDRLFHLEPSKVWKHLREYFLHRVSS